MFRSLLANAHYQQYEFVVVERLVRTRFFGKKVLDVGCGQGKYLRLFKKYDCEVTGIDINEQQMEQLRSEGFAVQPPKSLPPEESFDVIFCAHVIEHCAPDALPSFLEHYLSHLRADGRLILISPTLGERFYYDFTHIRPYYPQAIWMLAGSCTGPASYKSPVRIALDDIYFFNDAMRLRGCRHYYPCVAQHEPQWRYRFLAGAVLACNVCLALAYRASGGRLGVRASWLGVYKKLQAGDR